MTETIVLGAGCFWCTEAVFAGLAGVIAVEPGYTGGRVKNPTYEEVCTGQTGHIEVAKVEYNPEEISVERLLEVFLTAHDPYSKDKQGADAGSQYRSAVFFTKERQRQAAEKMIKPPMVTEIRQLADYYPAEAYHQNYYKNHPDAGYCKLVIAPKVSKINARFGSLLK